MTVSDWMTAAPVSVAPDAGLLEVRSLLRRHRFRHMPVVEGGRVVGVVSDRDVLEAVSPFLDTPSETHRDVETLARTAREFMTPDPLTVAPEMPLAEAAARMIGAEVSSLLVVGPEGALAGILTARDILRATAGQPAAG